jgi:hypothetical protein
MNDKDITVVNHGTIILVHLNTPEAREWVRVNVPDDAMFHGDALVVEPRYLDALIEGMYYDGLVI